MSRKKNNPPAGVDLDSEFDISELENESETETSPPAEEPAIAATIQLALPVAPFPPSGYRSRRLDLNLTSDQADALHRVYRGLQAEHAQLASGKHVDSPQEALRCLLERINAAQPINPN